MVSPGFSLLFGLNTALSLHLMWAEKLEKAPKSSHLFSPYEDTIPTRLSLTVMSSINSNYSFQGPSSKYSWIRARIFTVALGRPWSIHNSEWNRPLLWRICCRREHECELSVSIKECREESEWGWIWKSPGQQVLCIELHLLGPSPNSNSFFSIPDIGFPKNPSTQ